MVVGTTNVMAVLKLSIPPLDLDTARPSSFRCHTGDGCESIFFAAKAATFTLRSCRYKSPVTERPLEDGRLLPRTVRSPGGPIGGRGDGAFPTDEEEEVLPWSEVGAAVRLASVSG